MIVKRNGLLVIIFCILCLSCLENTKGKEDANYKNADNNQKGYFFYGYSEEENTTELLLSQHEVSTKRNRSLLFIKKINLGISSGDNWLVEWSSSSEDYTNLYLHLIENYKIIKDYDLGANYNVQDKVHFNIMKDIPGKHINNGTSSVGDFNNDGLDEVFKFVFGGNGKFVVIKGYDSATDDISNYCYIPFDFIDPENGPAPVEFITYKGMEGFKVYYVQLRVSGGPGYVPEPMPNNNKWFFYTWDSEKRGYIRVEEIVE
jgi:hypothetical protein